MDFIQTFKYNIWEVQTKKRSAWEKLLYQLFSEISDRSENPLRIFIKPSFMTGKSPQLKFFPYLTLATKNTRQPHFSRFPMTKAESELGRS